MADNIKVYSRNELEDILNEQQKRFCESRLFNNKVKSYMIAYPDCEYKSASASATRLLEDVRINQYTNHLKSDIENITGVSKIRNVAELSKLAYTSIELIHDDWIDLKNWEEIKKDNPEILAAVELIDTKTEERTIGDDCDLETKYVKVKFFSKIQAIAEINKMMGYNDPDKIKLSGNVNVINLGDGEKP